MSKEAEEIIFEMLADWRGYDNVIANFRFPYSSILNTPHRGLIPPLMSVLETYLMAERLEICTPYINAVKEGAMTVAQSEDIIGLPPNLRQRIDVVMKYRGMPRMFLQLIIHSRLIYMTVGDEHSPYLRHLAVMESMEAPVIPVDDLC